MKNFTKKLLAVLVALVLIAATMIPAFASETKQAEVGSTVVYTLSIADSYQNISGIHFELYFDNEVMKIKDINLDNLPASTVNDNQNNDGRIVIVNSLINGTNGLACSEKTDLVTVTFEVIKAGNTEVQYYIPYMYDYDLVNIKNYTLTETVEIDSKVVSEDVPPVLADVEILENIEGFNKGDFENNENGKAESGDVPQEQGGVENATATPGSKVLEYTFSMADAKQKLSAIQLVFIYDTKNLKLLSVKTPSFTEATINNDLDNEGKIVVVKDFDEDNPVYSAKTDLVTLYFEVIGDENSEIKYFVSEMIDTEGVSLYHYTFTAKTVIDGEVVSDGKTPVLASDADISKFEVFNKGKFVNNAEGKGTGVKPAAEVNDNSSSENGSGNNILVIGLIAGAVIIVMIVLLVVLKSKTSKDENEENE